MVFGRTKQALSEAFDKFKHLAMSLAKIPYSIGQDMVEIGDKVADYLSDLYGDLRNAARPLENYVRSSYDHVRDAVSTYMAFSSEKNAALGVVNELSKTFGTSFVMTGYDKDVEIRNGQKIISYEAVYKPKSNIDSKAVVDELISIGFKVDQSGALSMYDDEHDAEIFVNVGSDGLLSFNVVKSKRLF